MSEKSLDICRLCSAPDDLICMFTGKQRDVRNSLRKMIKETVNIQIEQNQDVLSVCFNCLVDITHFYYFRLQCHQNQSNFKTILTSPTEKIQKRDSLSVDKLSLPDMDTTLHILEWLLSKQKGLSEYNGYTAPGDGKSQNCNIDSQSQAIQTTTECSEKSIQTENLVVLKQQSVQTIKNTEDNCSQTVKTLESVINGILLSKNKDQVDDKCCQTDFTTEAVPEGRRGRPPKKKLRTSGMKTKQGGIHEVIDNIFYEPLSKTHIDMECQTDMTVDPTIDDSIASHYFLGRDFKSPTSDLKIDFKEEKLSPYDRLMISTPPLSDEIKSSPNCSNLLQIHEGCASKI